MGIIKQLDKRTGITYVYESKAYWDKEKKQSRAIRTTGLAGGLFWPYKGLLPAKPKGLSKIILLLQILLRCLSGHFFLHHL